MSRLLQSVKCIISDILRWSQWQWLACDKDWCQDRAPWPVSAWRQWPGPAPAWCEDTIIWHGAICPNMIHQDVSCDSYYFETQLWDEIPSLYSTFPWRFLYLPVIIVRWLLILARRMSPWLNDSSAQSLSACCQLDSAVSVFSLLLVCWSVTQSVSEFLLLAYFNQRCRGGPYLGLYQQYSNKPSNSCEAAIKNNILFLITILQQ